MTDDFDDEESKRRKIRGMRIAAENNPDGLRYSQLIAYEIAKANPSRICDADMVGKERVRRGLPSSIGPAAGALFKNGMWEFTDHRRLSARTSNHSREIKVWRLKAGY